MGGGAGGGFSGTRGKRSGSSSRKIGRLYGKPGQIKRNGYIETTIGSDGRATKETHKTDHGFPKYHTNPHDHKIEWDKDGNPIFKK